MVKSRKNKTKRSKNTKKFRKFFRTDETNSTYNNHGFSHQLLKIAKKILLNLNESKQKVHLSLVLSTFKQLALNEIEASLFSIYLEKFCLRESKFSSEDPILFFGLLAKIKLSSSSESIKSLKSSSLKTPKLFESFSMFEQKYSKLASVEASEINQRYSSFVECENLDVPVESDYNMLVDEILKTSVSYNTENKADGKSKEKQAERRLEGKKALKTSSNSNYVTVPQYQRPSIFNSTIPIFAPSDPILANLTLSMGRGDSSISDFLSLSRGVSVTEDKKNTSKVDLISSRRSSDQHSKFFPLQN